MRAIVLAFTLKDQDQGKILAAVRVLKEEHGNAICIHGHLSRKTVLEKHIPTAVVDAIEETFPITLCMHNGIKTLRSEMANIAHRLNAQVIVIGDVKEGVQDELDHYKAFHGESEHYKPIFIPLD